MKHRNRQGPALSAIFSAVVIGLGGAIPAVAEAQNAALASANSPEPSPWKVETQFQNDTRVRGKDATGERVGLSKFRNTLQIDAERSLDDGWTFKGNLRGTFDGVYRLNSDQYGNKAGGPIQIENTAGPALATLIPAGAPGNFGLLRNPAVPHGGGFNQAVATAFGLPPTNAFGFDISKNPNEGLRVLGDRWHRPDGGVSFGVPVRPCNVDSRGCADFGGYGDSSRSELEFPEFNKNLDFIREAYVKKTVPLGDGKDLFLKIGRQQIVWGRTDLFRVLDVINPVDYSRNNIYDELQDIRIPLWAAQAEYRMGGSDAMQERNLQFVASFDKFRPNNLGQCGSPNVIIDAGCFFRGMKNLWDNGGTVANFAPIPPGTPGIYAATDFGPNQVGLRDIKRPGWNLLNGPIGAKYEGVTKGGVSFSLNALTYRSQLPSLHASPTGAVNPFTGGSGNTIPPAAGVPVSHLIAFDMHFPRVNLIGGSMDFQVDAIKTAVRLEGAFTNGEEFVNSARPELFSKNKVFRSVIGLDRPTSIPFINPDRTTLLSAQLFYQHIFNHERKQGELGTVGIPDFKDNAVGTLLIKASYMNDRLSPQLITAYDFRAHAAVISPQVDWLAADNLKISIGANIKRANPDRYKFDDCRSCNPYPPFTTYTAAGQGFTPGSAGLSGIEPLGRFIGGPIGTARKENEIYVSVSYKF